MIDKSGAWRRNLAHNIVRRADHQRWYAAAFNDVGDETDGLVAEGSIGNEQCEIDLSICQFLGERGSEIILNHVLCADAAHERKIKRR